MMHCYAQTNIQLFNQLQDAGYTAADLARVRDAYALTMRLFTGCFRQSGKIFISHLVGTASILADSQASAATVTAGMLHSAYSHGEFGTGRRGISEAKREQLRQIVGDVTEELVASYTSLPWDQETISAFYQTLPVPGSVEREVLLIRLANELEDHLDFAALYSGNSEYRRNVIDSYLFKCPDIAEKLGFPKLASGLSKVFEETLSVELPQALQQENTNLTDKETVHLIHWKSSFLFPPATHGLRMNLKLRRILRRRILDRVARFTHPH